MRILVVDDYAPMRHTVRLMLQDHQVDLARSGREALELLERVRSFDAVLLDLNMPGLSGLEVYTHLQSRAPESCGRVIFMTGGATSPVMSQQLDALGNPSIEKPFREEELRAALERVSWGPRTPQEARRDRLAAPAPDGKHSATQGGFMTKLAVSTTVAALVLMSAFAVHAQGNKAHAKAQAITLNPGDLKWGAAPPNLPHGAQLAVLHGDPTKHGVFTMRLKIPAGYKIPPHWHTMDEQLTIISGTFTLHMGDSMSAPPTAIQTGGFHFLPGKMHHSAEVSEETVVQIDGMGPFDIHYLNPADDPSKRASTP